jgi:hypothetical protein
MAAGRAGRSGVPLAARPGQHRSGACAMAKAGLTVSTKRSTGAPSKNTRGKRTNAFWRCWISQSPRVMPAGRDCSCAAALGDVDVQYIWRFLRAQKIDLVGRKSWCESSDPEFAAKAADVVGLYMVPPENAIVLCVDEKPSIQALERAKGFL